MPGKQKNSRKTRSLPIILVTLFLLFSSSGCGLVIGIQENNFDTSSSSTEIINNIEFIAELFVPLQEEETLAIDIVDEIKGIPNNITRYKMTRIDDLHFHVIISAMAGSNVSYRYSKIGASTQNEVTVIGKPVRYRLFHVGEVNQVLDSISGWTENDYSGFTGNLIGSIVDEVSGEPIPDVLICFAGYQEYTDPLGKFSISNIPVGIHNFVGFPIDGAYEVIQQYIQIDPDVNSTISIELTKLKAVTIKFVVNSPSDYENGPIRIAGNLYQFGNTFADLKGGVNLLASRMPVMTELTEGSHYFEITLHEGNDLHYLYSLGDGFWNTEQGLDVIKGYRQIIVPDADVTIFNSIQSWSGDSSQSLDFSLVIPDNTPRNEIISIQLGTESWFEPIPMVSSGGSQWKFSLFTPYPINNDLNYRFCRNYECELSASPSDLIKTEQLSTFNNKTAEVEISNWPSWTPVNSPPTIFASNIPTKEPGYLTGIEFLPDYHPSYLDSYLKGLAELKEKGINTIILYPSRSLEQSNSTSILYLAPHYDLLIHDIVKLNLLLNSLDMNLLLSPYLRINSSQLYSSNLNPIIAQGKIDAADQYKDFILSYAQLASNLNEEEYIIDLFNYYQFFQENNSDNSNENQLWDELPELISEVKSKFSGQVVCSLPLNYLGTFPFEFLDSCDAFYFQFSDVFPQEASFRDVKDQIGSIIDDLVLPIYKSTHKPILIGFSSPSRKSEEVVNMDLSDHGSFSPQNSMSFSEDVDLEYQNLIYNAFLNEIMSREWIQGIIARDYYAPLKLTDASSSINGKPAMDVLWYWYTGVR